MAMEILGHAANALYVAALLTKNAIWMRALLIAGSILDLSYSLSARPSVLWVNALWSSIWVIVNVAHLTVLLAETFGSRLTDEESRVYRLAFPSASVADVAKLMKFAKWETYEANAMILRKGAVNDRLYVICSGVARIEADSGSVAYLKDGNFIGEMSYITGNLTCASVVALSAVRLVSWDTAALNQLLRRNSQIAHELNCAFSVDLAKKLARGD